MKPDDIRKNYGLDELNFQQLPENPIQLFGSWWQTVLEHVTEEANAMVLSTLDAKGEISSRVVLLKGIQSDGFEFFTNYESNKAKEIDHHSNVSLLFFWKELERQVRIKGVAEKVSSKRSQEYFQSRPLVSQISAWASPQSREIEGRKDLLERVRQVKEKFTNVDPLPLPPFWGGYLVKPYSIEFWQGRPDRLHDRVLYQKTDSKWQMKILAP